MDSKEIAKVLQEIGDLLALTEDSPYKAQAYYTGAQTVRENAELISGDIEQLMTLPGIGKSLAKQISELKNTGTSAFYQEMQQKVPGELRKLLHVPGLGAKTIRMVLQAIKPRSLAELAKAIDNREIRKIKGLSSKTEAKLMRGLEMLQNPPQLFPLGVVLPLGRQLVSYLKNVTGISDVEIVGSTARGRESVGNINLVAGCENQKVVLDSLADFPGMESVQKVKENRIRGLTWFGLAVDVTVVLPEVFGLTKERLLGDRAHQGQIIELAAARGLNWDTLPIDAYKQLGLPDFPPELREGGRELSVPENLLQLDDICGDLHMHTRWSDGGCSVEEMALAAANKGYEYVAICDHSKNLSVARGLKPEQLLEQGKEIEQVNQKLQGKIKVLAGTETDILRDGTLDYPDEVLQDMDVVVASVHMRYKQGIDEMTARIERALKNPHVDILAHPTGRLLGKRGPYELYLERVFEVALQNNKAVEINASPSRLDLKDDYARMARDMGLKIVIDTDAHAIEELADMEYGVMTARRAGLAKNEVLNTKSLADLEAWLDRRKG